jgi:hypothetical protein
MHCLIVDFNVCDPIQKLEEVQAVISSKEKQWSDMMAYYRQEVSSQKSCIIFDCRFNE